MSESQAVRRRRTLSAALARLLPAGAGPGAVEAGAVAYVARRFDGHSEGPGVRDWLDALDRVAQDRWGARFAALEPPRQDALLRQLTEDPETGGARILHLLVLAGLEGSFCHPARGGNRDGAGWRFAGLDTAAAPARTRRCRAPRPTS